MSRLLRAGTFVHSIATGTDIGHDTLGGYFGNVNDQVIPVADTRTRSSLCSSNQYISEHKVCCPCDRWQQFAST